MQARRDATFSDEKRNRLHNGLDQLWKLGPEGSDARALLTELSVNAARGTYTQAESARGMFGAHEQPSTPSWVTHMKSSTANHFTNTSAATTRNGLNHVSSSVAAPSVPSQSTATTTVSGSSKRPRVELSSSDQAQPKRHASGSSGIASYHDMANAFLQFRSSTKTQ